MIIFLEIFRIFCYYQTLTNPAIRESRKQSPWVYCPWNPAHICSILKILRKEKSGSTNLLRKSWQLLYSTFKYQLIRQLVDSKHLHTKIGNPFIGDFFKWAYYIMINSKYGKKWLNDHLKGQNSHKLQIFQREPKTT